VFGAKLHWEQFVGLRAEALGASAAEPEYDISGDFIERLFPNATYVRIVRRNVYRQAISLWYALRTGTWSLATGERRDSANADVPYSFEGIERCRRLIENAELHWDRFLRFNGIEPIDVTYEELDAAYAKTVEDVARRLPLAADPTAICAPRTQRLADDRSQAVLERWARDREERATPIQVTGAKTTSAWRIRVAKPALPPLEHFSDAIAAVWERRMLSNHGPFAHDLELAFAHYRGGNGHVLCASNADAALTLVLRALQLPAGSRALVASLGFPSSVHAVEWNGLEPYFVDVDAHDWCMHPEQLDGRLDGVSVIVATHLFGVACDVVGLERVAEQHGVRLVFDAAQAAATWVGDRHVTDFGDASVVSFSGTKVVTGAEGAIAVLRSERVKERFERLRAYGMDRDGISRDRGLNAKLSELNAALACLTVKDLDPQVAYREALVQRYRDGLAGLDSVAWQAQPATSRRTPTFLVVAFDEGRDRVRAALAERGIESRPYFPPLHAMPRFAASPAAPLPVTERLGRSLLALPLYGELEPEVVEEVCAVIGSTLGRPQSVDGK
jgi:dTDP-4-amino-4,6-dideoxygalactose transaminase/LPS sulfotransferase NodH